MSTRDCLVRDLGHQPYEPVWRAMQRFTDARNDDTQDEVWLVEHDPVFTLGQAGKPEHVLLPGDIPVLHVDRGGQVTYHGPGQLVVYPLLDLRRLKVGVRDYVHRIEQAVIDTLAEWNIGAARRDGAPGVYVNDAKIAALGIRVRRGCTFHGLAFNVDMDLEPFRRINPCGYAGLQVTSMSDLGGPSSVDAVKAVMMEMLSRQFGLAFDFLLPLQGGEEDRSRAIGSRPDERRQAVLQGWDGRDGDGVRAVCPNPIPTQPLKGRAKKHAPGPSSPTLTMRARS